MAIFIRHFNKISYLSKDFLKSFPNKKKVIEPNHFNVENEHYLNCGGVSLQIGIKIFVSFFLHLFALVGTPSVL